MSRVGIATGLPRIGKNLIKAGVYFECAEIVDKLSYPKRHI